MRVGRLFLFPSTNHVASPTRPRARDRLVRRGEQSPYPWRLPPKASRYVSAAITREPAIRPWERRGA